MGKGSTEIVSIVPGWAAPAKLYNFLSVFSLQESIVMFTYSKNRIRFDQSLSFWQRLEPRMRGQQIASSRLGMFDDTEEMCIYDSFYPPFIKIIEIFNSGNSDVLIKSLQNKI